MAIKGYFMDGTDYSADDINNYFSKLVNEDLSSTPLFNVSGNGTLTDLNTAVSKLVSPGVDCYNENSCMVKPNSSIYKEGKEIMILPGIAFLPGGHIVEITETEYLGTPSTTGDYYVGINCSETSIDYEFSIIVARGEPDLPLAKIYYKGTGNDVTIKEDLRTFAQAKKALLTGNVTIKKSISVPAITKGSYAKFDIGYDGFRWCKITQNGISNVIDLSDSDTYTIQIGGSIPMKVSNPLSSSSIFFNAYTSDTPAFEAKLEIR